MTIHTASMERSSLPSMPLKRYMLPDTSANTRNRLGFCWGLPSCKHTYTNIQTKHNIFNKNQRLKERKYLIYTVFCWIWWSLLKITFNTRLGFQNRVQLLQCRRWGQTKSMQHLELNTVEQHSKHCILCLVCVCVISVGTTVCLCCVCVGGDFPEHHDNRRAD